MSTSQPTPAGPGRHLARALGALVLGGVLLLAVVGKVLHPAAFEAQIQAEGLGGLVPAGWLAILVLALEAGLGTALWLGVHHPLVLVPTSGLVVVFLVLTGRNYARALAGEAPADSSCGCFGNLIERTPAEAFWSDRGLLLVPLLLLLWATWRRPRELPSGRLLMAAGVALGVGVLAWKAPELPVDDWATRLRPGVAIQELCAGQDPRVCLGEVAPELLEGRHWVVLSELDEALTEKTPELNQATWDHEGSWRLWVLTPKEGAEVDMFRFTAGPAYELRGDVPPALLQPLYRTLPRSFEVLDGQVVTTSAGWPPWLEGRP